MDLLVVQLKAAIRRLLDTKGVRGRVLDKVNRYGEVVIGVILERPAPPTCPAPTAGTEREPREGRESRERDPEPVAAAEKDSDPQDIAR